MHFDTCPWYQIYAENNAQKYYFYNLANEFPLTRRVSRTQGIETYLKWCLKFLKVFNSITLIQLYNCFFSKTIDNLFLRMKTKPRIIYKFMHQNEKLTSKTWGIRGFYILVKNVEDVCTAWRVSHCLVFDVPEWGFETIWFTRTHNTIHNF